MADKGHVALPLSNMSGGVNRFVAEATPNQCADALDVIADQGEVRRRDAFVPVGAAAPHFHPYGQCLVADSSGNLGSDRTTQFSAATFYVGCQSNPFDGFDVVPVCSGVHGASNLHLRCYYWTGAAWTEIASVVDETRDYVDFGGSAILPMQIPGRVYWHTDQFAAAWAGDFAISAGYAFWIKVVFSDKAGTATAPTFDTSFGITTPGARVFSFAPVNGIFPVNIEGRQSIVVGADRADRNLTSTPYPTVPKDTSEYRQYLASGVERGAQLGVKAQANESTRVAYLLDDEGPMAYDTITWPRPRKILASDLSSTDLGSAGLTYGTSSVLTKTRTQLYDPESKALVPYLWAKQKFRGGQLAPELTPVSSFSVNNVRVTASGSGLSSQSGFYRGCRIRVTTKGSGGTPLNEEREVYEFQASTTDIFLVYPAWSVAPNADNRFTIYAPHAMILPPAGTGTGECFSNENHTITPSATAAYANYPSTWYGPNGYIGHYRIGRELRWAVDAAPAWSGVVDLVTGRWIGTNGPSGLLEFDGVNLRRFKADYLSASARTYVGALPDTKNLDANTFVVNPLAKLRRNPPPGAFIVQHQTRFFVAGDPDAPTIVRWSGPGDNNNCWPYLFEDIVRDAEADGVRGMANLGDRLVIFTATAIHEAVGPDENGRYAFVPAARGFGFVANGAVCAVVNQGSAQLVGIARDGIYAWSGGDPTMLLDQWERLLDGGVNGDAIVRACAVNAPHRAWVLFAVPSRKSNRNDRILVWDYQRNRWWVWSAPFGVRSMAIDFDNDGHERILFGTDDGFLMTLGDAATDHGTTISAFALSQPIQPFGGMEGGISGLTIQARTLAAGEQMTVEVLAGEDAVTLGGGAVSVDKGDAVWATGLWATVKWAKAGWKTIRTSLPHYARAHRIQVKVSGAKRWATRAIEILFKPRTRSGR